MARLLITVLACAPLAPAQEPGPRAPDGPLAPEEAAASFELHPDFEIVLVAAEPLIAQPVALDWDARGRMWAALAPSRPEETALESLPGALAILADTDGDGRMDERTDFALGLRATSFVFHRDGVIVAQAGEIAWLRDRDGDDRADETSVLYAGFAGENGGAGNLRWGLDGWVYGTNGHGAKSITGRGERDLGPIESGVFRFKPDGNAIETVVACPSELTGLDIAWDGELFFSPATESHLCHVVLPQDVLASARVGSAASWADVADHEPSFSHDGVERTPDTQVRTAGPMQTAGGCFATGGAWPPEYDGDHFVCAPELHLVHQDRLTPSGSTFSAARTRDAEFLVARDPGFRPVDVRVGPDGALYVLDAPDPSAPDRAREHGRIWRVQQHAARTLVAARLSEASEAELLAALEHPGRWQRATAQRLLLERELATDVLGALAHKALNSFSPKAKVHALWILALEDPERLVRSLEHLLRDPESSVRRNAVVALGTLDPWLEARAASRAMALVDDPDPRTRLATLVALRDVLASERETELLARYPALEDDWQRSAVLAIAVQEPARFVEASLAGPGDTRVLELVRLLAEDVGRRSALKQAVEIVLALGDVKSRSPVVAETALRTLERTLDPELVPWVSTPLDKALLHLLENESVEVALAALPLAERWSQDGKVNAAARALGRRLGGIAVDAGQGLEVRTRALTAMLSLSEERAAATEIAAALLAPAAPDGPRLPLADEALLSLVDALARTGDPAAARALCGAWPRLSGSTRERIFRQLLERAASTAVLLDALEAGTIPAAELGLEERHRLRNHPEEALARRARSILDASVTGTAATRDADALIAELLPQVENGGDPARGRAVFLESCASCHALRGVVEGARVGPDLTGKGVLGAAYLLPFLVDPEREIDPAYVEFVAELADGRLVDGVLARESDETVVLRTSAGETELRRSDLVELRSTGRSPMPTGFETLGAEALRDLFAFLASG